MNSCVGQDIPTKLEHADEVTPIQKRLATCNA
jgi:hypothetical protein